MTDGNWVLERAEALMDETVEDRDRVLEILNVLRQEVYPCSETFVYGQVCPELKRLEQFLELDDRTAQMILPYGLAAQLLLGEDDTKAAFFQQRYEELLRKQRRAVWETIETA